MHLSRINSRTSLAKKWSGHSLTGWTVSSGPDALHTQGKGNVEGRRERVREEEEGKKSRPEEMEGKMVDVHRY